MNPLIQPYIAMSSFKYYKQLVNCHGISHFYTFTKDNANHQNSLAVPDGCIDILFSTSDNKPSVHIYGSVLQPTFVFDDDSSDFFGVRFYPGGGYTFRDIKIKELINNMYDFTELIPSDELLERIATSNDFTEKISLFTNHYQGHLRIQHIKNDPIALKQFMLNKILTSKGQIRVGNLAAATGYSVRYVNKKFIEFFGIPPKVFCKIIRYQHVLNELKLLNNMDNHNSLIQIANDAGYYDQAHMYKDFSEFSAQSPGQYIEMLKQSDYTNKLIIVNSTLDQLSLL